MYKKKTKRKETKNRKIKNFYSDFGIKINASEKYFN